VETLHHFQLFVYYRLVTAVTAVGPDIISGAFAPAYTVSVTVLAFSIGVIVLGVGTLVHTKWSIFDMLAHMAVARTWACTGQLTFFVTFHALTVPWGLKESFLRITRLHALIQDLECVARQAELVAGAPAPFRRALLVAHKALQMALLRRLVILQQSVVLLRFHDSLPVDVFCIAEVIVLQDGHAA
jgi:hypothetical protein